MCQRVTCKTCGKPTYRGCGNHVEQVLADVPRAQRCDCARTGAAAVAAGSGPTASSRSGGFLARLRGARKNA